MSVGGDRRETAFPFQRLSICVQRYKLTEFKRHLSNKPRRRSKTTI